MSNYQIDRPIRRTAVFTACMLASIAQTYGQNNQTASETVTDQAANSTLVAANAAQPLAITIYGSRLFNDTTVVSPTSSISAEELEATNITTVEDAIAYEPGLVVRRRFIGDPNGVIGLRGSNEFQGSRSMVFVDGMPLHYHLQTRWNGSPRWSLVSPGEIDNVEVIYGPFSAEYPGNAMGGVVNITTKTPVEPLTVIETGLFVQDFDTLGTSENYVGGRVFLSHENRVGNWNYFLSYNHLQNESQPQTFYFAKGKPGSGTVASQGTINGVDAKGTPVVYYGDSGHEDTTTDLIKLKLGYDFGNVQWRSTIAYEQREREEVNHNNYLQDANGQPIWGDFSLASAPGAAFATSRFGSSSFQQRRQERDSLLIGMGLSGVLSEDSDWEFDAFVSRFEILDDSEVRTGVNPADPSYIAVNNRFGGRLTEIDDTGWDIFDIKLGTERLLGNDNARLSLGYHYDSYELNVSPYRYNSITGERGRSRGASGGEARTHALFAQYGYNFADQWDVALGLRYEDWQSSDSFTGNTQVGERSESGFSPKLSIARLLPNNMTVRYSIARALRFPIVEELYRNEDSGARQFDGNADLKPEDGLHHNLSWEKKLEKGLVRVNLFYEQVDDAIFNFSAVGEGGASISTALPVDEVTTRGVDFVYNQQALLDSPFDLRFNVTLVDAEITRNRLNPSLVGKQFPRIPKTRINALLTYHASPAVDLSGGVRYASDSFNELDNSDTVDNVFGARDDYLFFNLKANWQVSSKMKLSAGIDNLFDDDAYVFHPWPSRTFFVNAKYRF